MNLTRIIRAAATRWYVTLIGLALTAGLCFAVYSHVGPTYTRDGSALLVPGTQSIPEEGNAYLYLGDLTQASDVLVNSLESEQMQEQLLAGTDGTEVDVERDASTTGPIISIAVKGPDRASVDKVFAAAKSAVPATLAQLQNRIGVPDAARMSSIDLTSDRTATPEHKLTYEFTAVAGVAGLALTLLLIAIVDGLMLHRGESRRRAFGAVAAAEPAPAAAAAVAPTPVPATAMVTASAPAVARVETGDAPTGAGAPAAGAVASAFAASEPAVAAAAAAMNDGDEASGAGASADDGIAASTETAPRPAKPKAEDGSRAAARPVPGPAKPKVTRPAPRKVRSVPPVPATQDEDIPSIAPRGSDPRIRRITARR